MKRRTGADEGARHPLEGVSPFGVALGHRIRQARESLGLTGEQVVSLARTLGLGWERSTFTRIELGQRRLTDVELLLLPRLFGRSLAELLPDEPCALTDAAAVYPDELRSMLTEPPGLSRWHLPNLDAAFKARIEPVRSLAERIQDRYPDVPGITLLGAAHEGWADETTGKAAQRLGVDRMDIAVAAQVLWSHGLAAERDQRLGDVGGATAARRQARRGHITRKLLDELRPVIESQNHDRTGSQQP